MQRRTSFQCRCKRLSLLCGVAAVKGFSVLYIGKEGLSLPFGGKDMRCFHLFQPGKHGIQIAFCGFRLKHAKKRQSCAVGYHDLRLFRQDNVIFFQLQTLGKDLHKLRMELERAALKGYRLFNIQSLGQTADGLFGNGMVG